MIAGPLTGSLAPACNFPSPPPESGTYLLVAEHNRDPDELYGEGSLVLEVVQLIPYNAAAGTIDREAAIVYAE